MTMSAIGLLDEWDLLTTSEASSTLTSAKPAMTLIAMPPTRNATSIRSGFGWVRISSTPGEQCGVDGRRERQQDQVDEVHPSMFTALAR